MGLIPKLQSAMALQSCGRNSVTTYCWWARKFYAFTGRPASTWTGADVQSWMLTLHRADYSASSRKQALCAIAFIFKHVLQSDMGRLELPPMPQVRQTLRIIPSPEEIARLFTGLRGQVRLMASLLYGSGLRVQECCQLRIHDIDVAALSVRVHCGKGEKSRLTVLPVAIVPALRLHLSARKIQHDQDLAAGGGLVALPHRLAAKYPRASRELGWQWLFPSTAVRGQYRWHATPESIGKQMRAASRAAGLTQRVTPHTLRHAFATHCMRAGQDPRTVQDLLGHSDLATTMIYLHGDRARGFSPLDISPAMSHAAT
jgi:integron integrase